MKGVLVIRKYKNRRLYDTERSTHVTREQLLEIVRSGRNIQVQEAGTGEDVTVETLLQLIQSEPGLASSVLSADFLHFLIRTDIGALRRFFRDFLPGAMNAFQGALSGFPTGMPQGWGGFGPFGGFPSGGFSAPWSGFQPPAAPQQADAAAPAQPPEEEEQPSEMDELRQQMDEMRRELARLRKDRDE